MRRYWIPADFIMNNEIQLSGDIFHHICDVCRVDVSDQFEVLVDDGRIFSVELSEKKKKSATAKILTERKATPLAEPHIILALSFPRLPVFESVIEKSVELGVLSIVPFVSQFSFIRSVQSDIVSNKRTRWKKIIRSAQQQSGRAYPMELSDIVPLSEALNNFNRAPDALGLFCYEGATTFGLAEGLEKVKVTPKQVWIFVGSEGGFSPKEVELFNQHNLQALTLGEQVLRVETACMALVSVIKYKFGLLGGAIGSI